MTNTVIAVYDNFAQAQSAMKQLLSSGFTSSQVHLRPSEDSESGRESAMRALDESDTGTGTSTDTGEKGGGLRGFFRELFGGDTSQSHAHGTHYAEAVRRGSFMLAVDAADDQERDVATSVMEQFQPVDLDERAAQWRDSGWNATQQTTATPLTADELALERGRSATATTQQQVAIPIIEEELQVGKREVQRGGVRVFQRVVETPVQESIGLREEHVTIERHAVDQPATAADLESLKEGTIEVREMAEEAVVSKTARVVEEVVLGKEVSEKQATISDTVRRTDVEVEKIDTPTRASTTGTTGTIGTSGTTNTGSTAGTTGTTGGDKPI